MSTGCDTAPCQCRLLQQWTFLPSPLKGDMDFTALSTASRKNLLYENLTCGVLIAAGKKQSGIFSKAAEVPSVSVTQALKTMGIQQAWELRAWG